MATHTTKQVRFHLDLELCDPRDEDALRALAGVIEDQVQLFRSVATARVTQIVPRESDFVWRNA